MHVKSTGQMNLPMEYFRELDRNWQQGGRSFYFFDFDDNVAHLNTKIVLFRKDSDEEFPVGTELYGKINKLVGTKGTEWENYEIRLDDQKGSFRYFRELNGWDTQPLVLDMVEALQNSFVDWRGPSWEFFVHAVNNNRPISVITARGHHPFTIRQAIHKLVQTRDIELDPNYLSVYPVSHPETRKLLGDHDFKLSTAQLKKLAIKAAVHDAFRAYGRNPSHRFGMSDDDPHNVDLITEAMRELKLEFPENAFFVINTHDRKILKEEIFISDIQEFSYEGDQLNLFDKKDETDQ